MSRKAKYVCFALMLVVAACEVMLYARSILAEHEAETEAELLAMLKPGHTTMVDAKALFQTHGVSVVTLSNACGDPRGPCDDLGLGAANYPPIGLAGIELTPFPPVELSYFQVNLYFINGILDSINAGYGVGTTVVKYSRRAGEYNFRSSKWKYEKGGTVNSISVSSSGAAYDMPFPRFAFNYMYSVKRVDARVLWPTAPSPTTELHKTE